MSSTLQYVVPINIQALRIGIDDSTDTLLKWPEFYFPNIEQIAHSSDDKGIAVGPDIMQPFTGSTGIGSLYPDNDNNDGNDTSDAAGIRLHWALPNAVVNGNIGNDPSNPGNLAFPALPNRWLVTAYYYDKTNSSNSIQQWIVQSDQTTTTASTASWPAVPINSETASTSDPGAAPIGIYSTGSAASYSNTAEYLGTLATDISTWTDPGAAPANLDAISHYGPTFTAYYQHSATVFGFYDDLSTVGGTSSADVSVSYQVIGWYGGFETGESPDILYQALQAAQTAYNSSSDSNPMEYLYDYVQTNLGWNLAVPLTSSEQEEAFPGNSISDCRCVFNGMAINVDYDSSTSTYLQSLSPTVHLSIGNNLSEAVSSLILNNTNYDIGGSAPSAPDSSDPLPELEEKQNLEYLLNAFQQDLLRRLGPGNASNRIEEVKAMLHQSRFRNFPGGSVWLVRAASTTGSQSPSQQATEVTLPLIGAQALSLLNQCQETYDNAVAQLQTARQQLYIDWANISYAFNTNAASGSDAVSNDQASFLMAEIMNWAVLQAGTGSVVVSTGSSSDNTAYTMNFEPALTIPNTTVGSAVTGSGQAVGNIQSNTNVSTIASVGLAELATIIGVQLPTAISGLLAMIPSMTALANSQNPNLSSNTLEAIKTQLTNFQDVLNNISTVLSKSFVSSDLGTLSTTLSTQLTALDSLQTTIEGYASTISASSETNPIKYFDTNTIGATGASGGTPGLLNNSDSIGTILTPYSGIYDIQQAIVSLEVYYPQFAQNLTTPNVGYGYTAEALNLVNNAVIAVGDLSSTQMSNITSAIGGSDDPLTQVTTLISDVSSAITTLIGTPSAANISSLQTALEGYATIESNLQDFTSDLYGLYAGLMDSLPTGQQLVLAANIMNMVITAMDQDVVLQPKKDTPYSIPHEPVIALSEDAGAATKYLQKVNRNGASQYLPCRRSTDLVSALSVNGSDVTVPTGTFNLSSDLTAISLIPDLLNEGYLLAPQNNSLNNSVPTLITAYKSAQATLLAPPVWTNETADSVNFTGTLPYYSALNVLGEDNPFLPLYLSWQVTFTPMVMDADPSTTDAAMSYDTGIISDNFGLQGSDLMPGKLITMDTSNIQFNGQMAMSDGANVTLLNQLRLYFMNTWNLGKGSGDSYTNVSNALSQLEVIYNGNQTTGTGVWNISLTDTGGVLAQIVSYFKGQWGIDITGSPDTGSFTSAETSLYNAYTTLKTAITQPPFYLTTLGEELFQTYLYLKNDIVLAQGLSGFNASLLERIQGYQYPFNFYPSDSSETLLPDGTNLLDNFAQLWENGLAASSGFFPMNNDNNPFWKSFSPINDNSNIIDSERFSPFRAGALTINKLEIVDVFGQFITLDSPTVHPADSMTFSSNKYMGSGENIYLAPRFVEPMRLRFLWESAQGVEGGNQVAPFTEFNVNPAYSPVCGWIIPNHLDNSLFTYDANGDALGYFTTPSVSSDGLQWRGIPQSNGGTSGTLATDIENANPVFQNFINDFLVNLSGSSDGTAELFFQSILDGNQYLLGTGLKEKASLAVLKGRPLVIAQANLTLEQYGNSAAAASSYHLSNTNTNYDASVNGPAPANDFSGDVTSYNNLSTSYSAPLAKPYPTYDQTTRNTAGIDGINVPVTVGNDEYLNDGLIGYFLNGDFSTFYVVNNAINNAISNATKKETPIVLNGVTLTSAAANTVQLSLSSPSVTLTLVMDPRVPVHATTGVLPEQAISIPPDQYRKAIDSLKIYFTVTPVLLGSELNSSGDSEINYQFPLPAENGYSWSWVQPGLPNNVALQPYAANDNAKWDSYPLQVQDGWLQMSESETDDDS